MIRIDIQFFYGIGSSVSSLGRMQPGAKLITAWFDLNTAKNKLESLFATGWLNPAIKTAYAHGQALLGAIRPLTDRTDFDTALTPMEVYEVKEAASKFETVVLAGFAVADSYFVTAKGGYDTTVLITQAERCFPYELVLKCPRALTDIREAGKCLAFELSTAAGFHVFRATETVLRGYWDAVSGGQPPPTRKTLGSYLTQMTKKNFGSAKVKATLTQMKDLHRNPIAHPQDTLSLDEAVSLFGICNSAIGVMLKEIPMPTGASPLSLLNS